MSSEIITEPIFFFLAKGHKNNDFVKKYEQEKSFSSLFKCRLSKWKCHSFKFMIPFIIFRLNNSNSRATILDTVTLNGAARLQRRRCKPARSYCNSVTVHLSRTSFSCTHVPPLWWKNEVKQKFKEWKKERLRKNYHLEEKLSFDCSQHGLIGSQRIKNLELFNCFIQGRQCSFDNNLNNISAFTWS